MRPVIAPPHQIPAQRRRAYRAPATVAWLLGALLSLLAAQLHALEHVHLHADEEPEAECSLCLFADASDLTGITLSLPPSPHRTACAVHVALRATRLRKRWEPYQTRAPPCSDLSLR